MHAPADWPAAPAPLTLTPSESRDAPEKSLRQQITEYVAMTAPAGAPPDALAKGEEFIVDFIATTKLAPALRGEPTFTLRAQDRLAPFIVMKWSDEAHAHGCSPAIVDGARKIAADMIVWQQSRGVKAPD